MASYDDFSGCYDMLTEDVNYSLNAEKILRLFEKYDRKPTLLLDLACGTGGFTFEFSKRNIDVIGVDRSEGMLAAALKKMPEGAQNPLFLNQSAEELELFGTVDGAVCLLDSLNHITDRAVLQKAFDRVSLFLEPKRLFIFDVNTQYKHSKILGNNTFVKECENTFCVWQNQCEDGKTVDIFLDFFVEQSDGKFLRLCEDFSEKAYSDLEIKEIISSAGLEFLDALDFETLAPPKEISQRILYIVRKK